MAIRFTRSWPWATPSSPRSFPTKAGINAMAGAWDSRPRDVDSTPQSYRRKHGRHPNPSLYTRHETVPMAPWLWEFVPKPLSPRWHQCPCGIGPVQRDLYSAFWRPISIQQFPSPRVPGTSVLGRRRGGRRACKQHTSQSKNAPKRARAAPKHGHPSCRSAFTQKSQRSHTRATVPLQERESGSVEAPPRTPA